MSLKHALLGFLRRKPQTGYALKNEQFDRSVAYFWPADQTQIYKTLDKLVEDKLATSEIQIQTDRPNRKVYSITKAGKEELEQWLREPIEPPKDRDPLLVQLFFSDYIEAEEVLRILKSSIETWEQHLSELKSIGLPPLAKCSTREILGARLTLELGLKSKEAYLEWLHQAVDAVAAHEKKNKKTASKLLRSK